MERTGIEGEGEGKNLNRRREGDGKNLNILGEGDGKNLNVKEMERT